RLSECTQLILASRPWNTRPRLSRCDTVGCTTPRSGAHNDEGDAKESARGGVDEPGRQSTTQDYPATGHGGAHPIQAPVTSHRTARAGGTGALRHGADRRRTGVAG